MMQWWLHFDAALPQRQLRQRRQKRMSSGFVVVGVLVLLVWNLSGISIAPGKLVYSKVPVGGGEVRSVDLKNRSSSDIHALARVLGEAASDFSVISEACATIRPGERCKLAVEFRPQIPGPRSANLVVLLEGHSEPYKATLRGEGIPHPPPSPTPVPTPTQTPTPPTPMPPTPMPPTPTPPTPTPLTPTPTSAPTSPSPLPEAMVHIEPMDLAFDAEQQLPQRLSIANEGEAPLRVNVTIEGPDADWFKVVDQNCARVAAHGKCIITVRLEPHLVHDKSEYVAVLRLAHNGSNIASPQSVGLHFKLSSKPPEPNQGSPLVVEPGSLTFSGEANGKTATALPQQTVYIRNRGPKSVQHLSIRMAPVNKNFSYGFNCPQLEPHQTCRVTVDFSAVAPGSYTETLYVFSDEHKVTAIPISATLVAQPNRGTTGKGEVRSRVKPKITRPAHTSTPTPTPPVVR